MLIRMYLQSEDGVNTHSRQDQADLPFSARAWVDNVISSKDGTASLLALWFFSVCRYHIRLQADTCHSTVEVL